MSRVREKTERLFEVFLEVGKSSSEDEDPFILQKYPINYSDEEVIKSVPKFAFPCDTERYTTTVDHFTFTMTDLDSKFKFGFCRHATGAQTCFCIISLLPWFEVFYNFLNILAEITNRSEDNDVTDMLRAAYVHEVPSSGLPVTIVARQEMFSFKAPEVNKLPSIPASRNLTEYYNAIDTENMMIIFASMLHERRIVVTSKKLSRVTAVIHAASGLLYPMYWQHLYIPVLPSHLIDYLTAPMPFVIGVHATLMQKVSETELGDAVIVDADNNTVSTDYDDVHDLPDEMAAYLKRQLKGEKVKNSMQGTGDIISKTFMMSLVKLIGGYRDALKFNEGETITFCPEAFVQSRPVSMQPFLENMLHLQIFQQFINDRLDMLNCGRGFADIFEQECLIHADKLNAQTRYNEWLGKMKKQGKKLHRGGKDVWSDFKVKVKTQGKKVYSKAQKKIDDWKKDDDGTPKSSKSVRPSSKTKSFHKDISHGIIKDRPSTIVGTPIKSQRPPRPGGNLTPHKPQVVVKQPSIDRSSRSLPTLDGEKQVSVDDSDLMYSRVSMTLMEDPDIQNAIFKSASAENLPKVNPALKASDSSGTITSTSSLEIEGEPDANGGYRLKGDKSVLFYSALLEDDDSGIVMRTSSHTSLDQFKGESTQPSSSDKVDAKLPPPKPLPRRPSPNVVGVEDKLVKSRERPQPAPRKHSFGSSGPKPSGDSLIDFGPKTPENDIADLSDDFSGMNSAGDYVLLREPKSNRVNDNTAENRRISISRTPALKLGQDETPKRPSIRRERSPITPEEQKGPSAMLDFDPLFDSSSSSYTTPKTSNNSDQYKQNDNGDSLLKEWNIGDLTALGQTPKENISQSSYNYPAPTPPPRQRMNVGMPQFYTPQPYMTKTQTVTGSVGFQNPMSQPKTAPNIAPRPNTRQSGRELGVKSCLFPSQSPSTISSNQSDPFGDLISVQNTGTSSTAKPASSNWETFN
ncbi:DENN domain-containing protein [Mactra antiquata]